MKQKINLKKIGMGIFSVAAIGLVASGFMVSAYQGDPTKQGPDYNPDLHDLKVDAFEKGDYEVWRDLMLEQGRGAKRVLQVVNEDNFNIFVQAHNAQLEGDFETANELRAQLGLNNGQGLKDGNGFKKGNMAGMGGMKGNHEFQNKNLMQNNGLCPLNGECK
jgi:hypothetical protein